MGDFLGSLFCFYILWLFCKYTTLCNYPCLNRRFHIVVQSELLDRIFLYRPAKTNGWTPHLMGIDGIISYVTLIPSAIYLWIRDGKFLFFNPDGVIISVWFTILFWTELVLFLVDYWVFSCTALQKGIAVIPLEVAENGKAGVVHAYLGHAVRAAEARKTRR